MTWKNLPCDMFVQMNHSPWFTYFFEDCKFPQLFQILPRAALHTWAKNAVAPSVKTISARTNPLVCIDARSFLIAENQQNVEKVTTNQNRVLQSIILTGMLWKPYPFPPFHISNDLEICTDILKEQRVSLLSLKVNGERFLRSLTWNKSTCTSCTSG